MLLNEETLKNGYRSTESQKDSFVDFVRDLQQRIIAAFEELEKSQGSDSKFIQTPWNRPNLNGGGVMAMMRGDKVFEKVGVNVSAVSGTFEEPFSEQIPGCKNNKNFWAAGVSLVAHMHSPFVPAVHMNVRHISTEYSWFGGGADLNPMYPDEDDTNTFHNAFKVACDKHDPSYYPKFKEECDNYFYIKHRDESRGVGGIFFDYHNTNNWDDDFAFVKDVGEAFLDIYPKIVKTNLDTPWSSEHREHQLFKRGRYVEFNLIYDRGTAFGIKTGGNIDAILMSMPPEAKW